jgi:hypothetical protein
MYPANLILFDLNITFLPVAIFVYVATAQVGPWPPCLMFIYLYLDTR